MLLEALVTHRQDSIDTLYYVHAVVSLHQNCPMEVLTYVMNEYPEQISLRDCSGRLPLHIAIASTLPMSTKSLALRKFQPREQQMICVLLKRYPEAAALRDPNEAMGRYPLHTAVANGHEWSSTIKGIYQNFPNALLICDPVTQMYPFQMVASGDLDSTYQLLRQMPCTLQHCCESINLGLKPNEEATSKYSFEKKGFLVRFVGYFRKPTSSNEYNTYVDSNHVYAIETNISVLKRQIKQFPIHYQTNNAKHKKNIESSEMQMGRETLPPYSTALDTITSSHTVNSNGEITAKEGKSSTRLVSEVIASCSLDQSTRDHDHFGVISAFIKKHVKQVSAYRKPENSIYEKYIESSEMQLGQVTLPLHPTALDTITSPLTAMSNGKIVSKKANSSTGFATEVKASLAFDPSIHNLDQIDTFSYDEWMPDLSETSCLSEIDLHEVDFAGPYEVGYLVIGESTK